MTIIKAILAEMDLTKLINVHICVNSAKKLKQFAKQSEIKALKENHYRLK